MAYQMGLLPRSISSVPIRVICVRKLSAPTTFPPRRIFLKDQGPDFGSENGLPVPPRRSGIGSPEAAG